jgi:predicted patatin/cPLA2 family phospholipase
MKTALVVEGGGMRGIFSAGVLDAFSSKNFDPFDIYIGVSAGACNLSSFVALQYKRNYRIYTGQMMRPEFISLKKFLRGGHYMDLDWLWEAFQREDPLDVRAAFFNTRGKEFVIVCTSVESGMPLYLIPSEENWEYYLKASSSVPALYRNFHKIDSQHAVDGGVSDPIPVMEAYRRGARRIVVIRSRHDDYKKSNGVATFATSLLFRKSPQLQRAMRNAAAVYTRSVDFIIHAPEGVRMVHVVPPQPLRTGRTMQDSRSLQADYDLGLEEGAAVMDALE